MQKVPAPLRFISPMECLEVDQIPEGELWQYELKLDGYRTLPLNRMATFGYFLEMEILSIQNSHQSRRHSKRYE